MPADTRELKLKVTADASGARSELRGLEGSFTELNSAISVIRQGWELASGALESVFGPVIDYATRVRELATWTGDTAENTSALVLAADHFGISAGTLETALRTMSNNGLSPTIGGLRELATQFTRLPESDRPAWLIENFGRAGASMATMLAGGPGALDALTQSLQGTNLVLDDVDLERLRGLTTSMSAWGDAVLSLKMSIVDSGVLGMLTDMIYGLASALGALQDIAGGGNVGEALQGIFVQGLERSLGYGAPPPPAPAYHTVIPAGGVHGHAGGGPLGDVTLVGEQGQELVINGMVVPHEETERLLRLGLIPDQEAARVGEGGYGRRVAPAAGGKGFTSNIVSPYSGPSSGKGISNIITGGGGGGPVTSGEVAAIVEQVQQSAAEESAALVASIPAAAAQAAAEQGRAQVDATRQTGDEMIAEMKLVRRAIEKLNRTLPTYISDAVERVL